MNPLPIPPTGTDPATVQAYYDWLYGQYYQTHYFPFLDVNWDALAMELVFGLSLIAFFILFGATFPRAHRPRHELYGLTTFAGDILEREGPVPLLLWLCFIFFALWAIFFIVYHIVHGQIY